MKKQFFYFLFFFNIIKFICSDYTFGDSIEKEFKEFEYSMEKDLGQCTCDLSSLCDYNCPCDEDCENFEKKGKDRLEEYKCQSLEEKFKYNKNNASISIKDHIFSLMCIHFDRSGDMGEFYKEEPNEDNSDKKRNWIEKFFEVSNSNTQNDNEQINLNKSDSNGYCMRTYISELKNTEFSCIDNNHILSNSTLADYINDLPQNTSGIYYINGRSNIINYKISLNANSQSKNRPKGYSQGSPIKINYNNENYNYDQYYLPIIDSNGNCLRTESTNSTININPLLFKTNAIYSCRNSGDIDNTFFYNFLCSNNKAKICSSPDQGNCNIDIICNRPEPSANLNNIELYIFTSKEGKESSPYEVIKGSLAEITQNGQSELLTLNIKYIDVSSSSYYNTKDGKITSLISLDEKLLNSIKIND